MTQTLLKTIADFSTTLNAAVAVGATSATLTSATDSDGVSLPAGTYSFTIDRKNSSKEHISATVNGTALTNVKTLARGTSTGTAGFARAHRKGAEVIISDFAALKRAVDVLDGTTDLDSATPLAYDAEPTLTPGSNELATVVYVDEGLAAGASNASTTVQGLVEEATQAEVDARTTTGGTGAKLFAPLDKIRASLYHDYAADAGANDTYAITITPAATAYTTGMVITFKANTANTGACTVNVSGLGAKSLKINKDLDPQDGYIKAGQDVMAVYDGTNFQIISVGGKPVVSQTGEEIYGASSSGNDTYVVTLAPAPAAYATGMVVNFKPDTANTGAATLNVNSLGAKTIKKNVSSDLETGDILASQMVQVIYDGTNFQLTGFPSGVQPTVIYKNGQTTRDLSTASGNQTITHGLGKTPKFVRITVIQASTSGAQDNYSFGVYNGTTNSNIYRGQNGNGQYYVGGDTTNTINIMTAASNDTSPSTATVTYDSTNITLAWTKASTASGTAYILWEAEA